MSKPLEKTLIGESTALYEGCGISNQDRVTNQRAEYDVTNGTEISFFHALFGPVFRSCVLRDDGAERYWTSVGISARSWSGKIGLLSEVSGSFEMPGNASVFEDCFGLLAFFVQLSDQSRMLTRHFDLAAGEKLVKKAL